VAGYCIALDMVVRGSEDRSFRKSIDTYAVAGPWLVTADEIPAPGRLKFSLSVNGEVRQASDTQFMIMSIERQIAWASTWYPLYPGDIIMTGTCEGVSRVVPGDVMHCEIEQIGAMDVAISATWLELQHPLRVEVRDLFPIRIADRKLAQKFHAGRVGFIGPVDRKQNIVGAERHQRAHECRLVPVAAGGDDQIVAQVVDRRS